MPEYARRFILKNGAFVFSTFLPLVWHGDARGFAIEPPCEKNSRTLKNLSNVKEECPKKIKKERHTGRSLRNCRKIEYKYKTKPTLSPIGY